MRMPKPSPPSMKVSATLRPVERCPVMKCESSCPSGFPPPVVSRTSLICHSERAFAAFCERESKDPYCSRYSDGYKGPSTALDCVSLRSGRQTCGDSNHADNCGGRVYDSLVTMKNLGILLSGRGSNFEAIADNVASGKLDAKIAVVISNRADAGGIESARRRGLKALVIPSKGKPREQHDREVVAALREHQVDLVCLAGYMRLRSPWFVQQFP